MRGIKIFLVVIFVAGFFIFIKNFVFASGLVINEFVPTGDEGVELYNGTTESIDITDWVLGDSYAIGGSKKCFILSGIILPGEWKNFTIGSGCLNDSSNDSVVLKNKENEIVDFYSYKYVKNVFPKAGFSFARLVDGFDTDQDSDWSLTPIPTPGSANLFPLFLLLLSR